jgi:ubiquinone/menaquinone biosynthesis C-methylase UbiE
MDLLISFFRKFKPQKILDIGCGSGYLGYLIKKIDSDTIITGFDISKHALGQAKSYDKTYFLDIDKENIPEEDNYFDMVICADVLEHIYDVDHCLNEIKRVLKPGSKAIVTTPNFSYWKYRIVSSLGGIPSILKDPRHIHTFNLDFLSTKCYTKDVEVAYSIKEKKGPLTRTLETIFNKTIVLVLTKKSHE